MKAQLSLLAIATALAFGANAQTYYLAGDFNTWSANANPMTGGPDQYDFTITGQTPGAYGQVKVTDGTFNNTWPSQNMVVMYDATGSATVHFYPGSFSDGWLPVANRVGYDDPGTLNWGMAGDFDGWDGTQALLPPIGSGVFSNSIVVANAGTSGFKFQSPAGSWDNIYFGSDFGNGGGNGSFTTTTSPETLPVVLDVVHGRYLVGSLAPPPVTNTVVFAVDMSYQIQLGNFHPGSSVYVAGDFNGWPGASAGTGLLLVNAPPYDGVNTNIYYGTNTFVGLPNSVATGYKFNQNDPAAPNSGWETSNNRSVTLLSSNGTIVLPVVFFSDTYPSDVLTAPTPVTFSVDMTGAVEYSGAGTHAFDPGSDTVYVNGTFPSWYAWGGGINPAPAPPGFQLFQDGSTMIYTNTILMPVGTPVGMEYKYGMDPFGLNGGPLDDEAGFGSNHFRVVRSTAINPYVLPVDTFGNQYKEPFFASGSASGAQLRVGAASGGTVPVSWLGRPGAHLQVTSDLLAGSWSDLSDTDGTNWTAGYTSTNGFVSVTNFPATGNAFFRLVKP